MPDMNIPKPLLPFLQKKKRFKIAIGGRGSGKSMTFADLCLMDAQIKGIKTVCLREYQNSISDSVHAILQSEIERMSLSGFEVQQQQILCNGVDAFKFRGMARNVEGLKSMHDFDRAWVEEAATASYQSIRALTPTIRKEGSEIWMSANLRSMADPFTQRFFKPFEKELRKNGYYEDDLHLIVWINHDQNPFFPEVLEQERAYDEAHMSKAEYNHVWMGELYDEVMGSIIPVEWFEAAIDAHLKLGFKPEGAKAVAFDPSDTGTDPAGFAYRHGSVYMDICDQEEGDINEKLDWAVEKTLSYGADHFTWDIGGMGTGLKREVANAFKNTRTEYHLFNGAESADEPDQVYQPVDSEDPRERRTNKETFANRRASRYFGLADRFEKTYRAVKQVEAGTLPLGFNVDELISLSSSIDQLDQIQSEVCRIPQKKNANRKQIMTKAEMAKPPYELPSPNMADCMMMDEYLPPVKVVGRPMKSAGWG